MDTDDHECKCGQTYCGECGTEKKSDLEETEELCDECGVPMSIHEETKGMDN